MAARALPWKIDTPPARSSTCTHTRASGGRGLLDTDYYTADLGQVQIVITWPKSAGAVLLLLLLLLTKRALEESTTIQYHKVPVLLFFFFVLSQGTFVVIKKTNKKTKKNAVVHFDPPFISVL